MPLVAHMSPPDPPIGVVFDKPAYSSQEPIGFRVAVGGGELVDVTFRGSVVLPNGTTRTFTGTTRVDAAEYGRVDGPGYAVARDPDDNARYIATPEL
ncbi:hypothetical protein I0C86_41525 [Plantactinospora sp. S1510]|uniref:Uncharacterized protein n=1 Tax=Plantactinospora alkalitolerans TaxID=2789879 RepID=A0ABS0HA20_9ACTN|nr:hypothetical protein [Plantactinospora alkalitolerans]MBF9135334.1 hypothetical protein [Plantactinospora alkalitolerans]